MDITIEQVRAALESNPTLTLLKAYSRDWVLPLFAECLAEVDSVSAEWFHEKVDQAREHRESHTAAADHCRDWVDKRWLQTETGVDGTRYRLSPDALRAIDIVIELAQGESTVSGARFESISHAVSLLADMTNPDREAQARRVDAQIAELQQRRRDIAEGRTRLAGPDEMRHQLREILAMTRSLPADFRQLRTMVEDRHQQVARRAMLDGAPKRELVEEYLRENDLLLQTTQGTAYLGFTRQLSSQQAQQLRTDIDAILAQDFAVADMTADEREELDTMLSTLLAAELEVQTSYVRWSASLRRFLTRASGAKHQRLLALADRALAAGADWVQRDPGSRQVPADLLGIGPLAATDVSQIQLWTQPPAPDVVVEFDDADLPLPDTDREALRLSAGTSTRAVGRAVNDLLQTTPQVTGAEVFQTMPAEFRRLGVLISILDIGVAHGRITTDLDTVHLAGSTEELLMATLPHVVFDSPVPDKESA